MDKTTIGDRMKNNYENITRYYLTRRMPVIIRVDGRSFHTFTKGFKKPFDDVTKSDVEQMVVAMRKAGLAHNSIARPSDELDPFGEEFTEMAEKLRKLNEEQQAQALRRMNIHSEICDRFGIWGAEK